MNKTKKDLLNSKLVQNMKEQMFRLATASSFIFFFEDKFSAAGDNPIKYISSLKGLNLTKISGWCDKSI